MEAEKPVADFNQQQDRVQHHLAELMMRPEEQISLAEAALAIAASEYPNLDAQRYIRRLDGMAETLAGRVAGETDPFRIIAQINHFLYQEEGFFGNTQEYYDPRNSFLNEVLDRKVGIPITLSTIYLEIAERLRFPLVGVGMPGHFLVKHPYFQILIDPFGQGRILTESDCKTRMEQVLGDSVEFHPSFLDGVGKRHIVMRMLNNLRAIYLNARQYAKALEITDLSLAVQPDSAEEHKQRAALLLHLRRYSEAAAELHFYVEHSPDADDAQEVRETLANLRRTIAQMN